MRVTRWRVLQGLFVLLQLFLVGLNVARVRALWRASHPRDPHARPQGAHPQGVEPIPSAQPLSGYEVSGGVREGGAHSAPRPEPHMDLYQEFMKGVSVQTVDLLRDQVMVVVAHHKEDLQWLRLIPWNVTVYSDTLQQTPLALREAEAEGRVRVKHHLAPGREASHYLKYLVDHRSHGKLRPITAFVHAHRSSWHQKDMVKTLQHVGAAAEHGYMTLNDATRGGGGFRKGWASRMIVNQTRELSCYAADARGPNKVERATAYADIKGAWGAIFESYLGSRPDHILNDCCAQFAVTWDRVRALPREFYKGAYQWLEQKRIPPNRSARVFEQMWRYIFTALLEGPQPPCAPDTRGKKPRPPPPSVPPKQPKGKPAEETLVPRTADGGEQDEFGARKEYRASQERLEEEEPVDEHTYGGDPGEFGSPTVEVPVSEPEGEAAAPDGYAVFGHDGGEQDETLRAHEEPSDEESVERTDEEDATY